MQGVGRTFIGALHALLNSVGRFSKDGAPDLGVDGHEGREEADLAFRCFGGSLIAV